jgi:catechol 2,3-dioxygenase
MLELRYKTKLGHVHLKVRDLDCAIEFYTRFLSVHLVERVGDAYAFLTGGEFHHEIALQNDGAKAPAPPPNGTGLYHVAFEVPHREAFARAYQTLIEAGISVAAVNHLISWAMYFEDPDGNGLEIYWDTRREPRGEELWRGVNVPLEPGDILLALKPA